MDDQMPKTPGKFKRFLIEVEVEEVDPIAAAAYNMNLVRGDDGTEMSISAGAHAEIKQAVGAVVASALHQHGERVGFRTLGTSTIDRPLDEDGNYAEFPFPAMPGRNDDGTLKDL